MVNKGKGCLTAIFDGSIPIGIVKHGLDTVFSKSDEPSSPLDNYTILDAIYGNGNQYAIIDYYANQNTKVEMQFAYTKNSSHAACLYASRTAYSNGAFSFMPYVSTNNKTRSSFGTENKEFNIISDGIKHIIVQDGIYTYIDGVLKTTHTRATFTAGNPMHILTQSGALATKLQAKIYYMKIWDNETLVHDLIPVEEKSTGIVGLFDKVTNEFITSETDTEFIAVYPPIKTNYNEIGLLANYVGFNCEGGNIWEDVVGGNNITMYNNTIFNNEAHCWSFNGTNNYGKGSLSAPPYDFTMEFYGSVSEITDKTQILAYFGSNFAWYAGYGAVAKVTPSIKEAIGFIGNQSNTNATRVTISPSDILDANVKTKVVLSRTQSNGKLKIYIQNINGNASNEVVATTSAITADAQQLSLGAGAIRSDTIQDYRKYDIYALRVYDRVLTDEEIAQNHAEDVRLYGQ